MTKGVFFRVAASNISSNWDFQNIHRLVIRNSSSSSSSSSNSRTTLLSTPYTITAPTTDPEKLQSIVQRHVTTLDRYQANKPISDHTTRAFEQLQLHQLLLDKKQWILDSGCGTGRSTVLLGEKYPNHLVIGVDRSIARLAKNEDVFTDKRDIANNANGSNEGGELELVQQVRENVWLVRAELVDFWRCCCSSHYSSSRTIPPPRHHYLLYPNPYPKQSQVQRRWYAHPSFALLCHASGWQPQEKLIVRSNWYTYLQEFQAAWEYATAATNKQPNRLDDDDDDDDEWTTVLVQQQLPQHEQAWTNFEQKYWDVGEPTYELTIQRKSRTWQQQQEPNE